MVRIREQAAPAAAPGRRSPASPMPLLALAVLLGAPAPAAAVKLDELPPGDELRVRSIEVTGNESYSSGRLRGMLTTTTRPWYAPWRSRPVFDPYTFEDDLERLKRFYESEGHYEAGIDYDLELEGDAGDDERLVSVKIRIDENERVVVDGIEVGLKEAPGEPSELPEELPLERGEPFTEDAYHQAESALKKFFLSRSHAFVETERSASVDLEANSVDVRYFVERGPEASFGDTRIEGLEDVDPHLVRRELEWEPGRLFSLSKVEESRESLLALELFRSVRIGWERDETEPDVADMTVRVEEKPPREIRIGVGYGTEDEFRGQASWRHYNWLGGGRQLTASAQYSTVTSSVATRFVQPHFLSRRTRAIVPFRQDREVEDTFTLLASRLEPHLEHRFLPALTGRAGWGSGYASLSEIDEETEQAIGGVKRSGFLSGPSLGLVWDTTDDPLAPAVGHVVTLAIDQRGGPFGGSYRFYKIVTEGKKYWSIGWRTVLATRLEIGLGDTLGDASDFPIFERYYAGGSDSVRGYGRRRLGPLSSTDRPLGGLSLVEGSFELRRPVWGALGAVAFVDFGQVSRQSFDPPVGDLEFSAGPGITYATPIGPLSLFLGFPFDPPPGDSAWQIHFSIGQFF